MELPSTATRTLDVETAMATLSIRRRKAIATQRCDEDGSHGEIAEDTAAVIDSVSMIDTDEESSHGEINNDLEYMQKQVDINKF